MRITVGSLKGGTAKTTTAVHLALGLARSGRVLLVDADTGQGSAMDWSTLADDAWPDQITVVPWATRDLAKRVRQVADDYDHVVTDLDPKSPHLLLQSLRVAPTLIIPVMPRPMDLRELPATFETAAEADDEDNPVSASVLLVMTRGSRHRLTTGAREYLADAELPVMGAHIPLRDQYTLAYGTAAEDLGAYEDVLIELKEAA